jgi:NADH dehydrogenase (ubiquinone) Fe-S protein 5
MACYVVNTSGEDKSGKKKCGPALEDYYECLHHKKEVSVESVGRSK